MTDCAPEEHKWFTDSTFQPDFDNFRIDMSLERRVCTVCKRVERRFGTGNESEWLFVGHSSRLEKFPTPNKESNS